MASKTDKMPHFRLQGETKQFVVDGQPYLILGAELQNSSMTSARFLRSVWPNIKAADCNTVLGCVTWEQIEPQEGVFDFTELDQVILDARQHDLRLILLWFGSFKNGLSTYTPSWVKLDTERFPRAFLRQSGGRLVTADVLSLFGMEARDADTRAFRALMQHLRSIDQEHSTVIMVQVQNEVGLMGDSRDGGPLAEKCFTAPVPKELIQRLNSCWDSLHPELKLNLEYFRDHGQYSSGATWTNVFGSGASTDEIFMAYHYALYVEHIALAGKVVYPIPLYTNVAQKSLGYDSENPSSGAVAGGAAPGEYPSGGAVASVIDIWLEFAPTLDLLAPDIYLNNYAMNCAIYCHRNNPLFIPEQRRDEYGARRIWAAYGTYGAIGCCPFGFDTLKPETNPFRRHYGLLKQVSHHVLAAQARPGSSIGFYFDELPRDIARHIGDQKYSITLGNFKLEIERSFVFGHPAPGFGMVIHLSDPSEARSRYLLAGFGFQVKFKSKHVTASFAGILDFVELEPVNVNGKKVLQRARMLNGDETGNGKAVVMPSDDPDYGGFPISVTIPGRTGIAEFEAYSILDS